MEILNSSNASLSALKLNTLALKTLFKRTKVGKIRLRIAKIKAIKQRKVNSVTSSEADTTISSLKRCSTKASLRAVLVSLSPEWTHMLCYYVSNCFLYDIYSRRLETRSLLLSKQRILYKLICNPDLLNLDCHFDNNVVKNFCCGAANFILKNYEKFKDVVSAEKREKERTESEIKLSTD